jgi:hypothetical protein
MSHTPSPTISIRAATAADGRSLMRLAALDSATLPFGPTLVAEVDGEPKAALALREDRVIADPFTPTADLVSLLRVHAATLTAASERRSERAAHGRLRLAA